MTRSAFASLISTKPGRNRYLGVTRGRLRIDQTWI
jgi:hypothetical protein